MKSAAKRLFFKQQLVRVGKRLCLSTILFLAIPTALVEAQVTPDESLSTNAEQQGENQLNINGGEREGNNLFHSFEEFSIPEGIEAVFENAPDIENIFTRITGESASSINGILRTQGGANFFLVNPNGIIFGENASLDIGGSFIATTADSIQFEDGTEFIASQGGQEKPILTVSVPIGLQFDGDSGAITVNGNGSQIKSDTRFSPIDVGNSEPGISVASGKTIALIGGAINLPGGIVTAEGGKIEIGSVNSGFVRFQNTESGLTLGYDSAVSYQDITLSKQALFDTSGEGRGAISLTGKNISLSNGSFLLDQNRGDIDSGSININALESLNLSGTSRNGKVSSSIRSESLSLGQASDINIFTKQLLVRDVAQIRTGTYSKASGRDVNVEASDSIKLISGSISNSTFAEGNAGNLQISTSRLEAIDAGGLTSATVGAGDGGQVTVNADLIELVGGSSFNRSGISASSFSNGNAGSLNISSGQLYVKDGASVSSSSFANGDAGNLNIEASESINVSGVNQNITVSSNRESSIRSAVQASTSSGQRGLNLPAVPTGNGGDVTLNTPSLVLSQQASVTVENQGSGNGGELLINADRLNLENAGNIAATTVSGSGGNIKLNAENLQIDGDSNITATADNNGDGGNVTINTTSLIAKKNSQVTANAFGGRGGNINIDAEGVFLFDSPSNIFSASSELGIDGEIQINTPDINFQKELEQSELEILTAEQAIASSCLARSNQQASFTVGGNGGLPKNSDSNYSDANFSLTGVGSLPTIPEKAALTQRNLALIPAEKMVSTTDGRIFLVTAPYAKRYPLGQKAQSLFCPKN